VPGTTIGSGEGGGGFPPPPPVIWAMVGGEGGGEWLRVVVVDLSPHVLRGRTDRVVNVEWTYTSLSSLGPEWEPLDALLSRGGEGEVAALVTGGGGGGVLLPNIVRYIVEGGGGRSSITNISIQSILIF